MCPICGSGTVTPSAVRSEGYDLSRCRACGFMWVPDVPTVNYEDYGSYLSRVDLAAEMRSMERHWGRWMRQAITDHGPGATLLDVGCGAGFFVHYCRQLGFAADGFEPSAYLRNHARQALGIELLDDMDRLLASGRRFSIITVFEVLEHVRIEDLDGFIGTIQRLLSPGGTLLGTTPNPESLNVRLLGGRDPAIWPPSHVSYFSRAALHAFLSGHGLVPRELFTYGLAPIRARKDRPSFVTAPRSRASRLPALALRALLYGAGRLLTRTRLGYTTAFAYRQPAA